MRVLVRVMSMAKNYVAAAGKIVLLGPDRVLVELKDSEEGFFQGDEPVYLAGKRFISHIQKALGNPMGLKVEIKIIR